MKTLPPLLQLSSGNHGFGFGKTFRLALDECHHVNSWQFGNTLSPPNRFLPH
jgi:hypothetical protein